MKKTKKTIVIRIEKHRKETVYSLKFIYDRDLIAICKNQKLDGAAVRKVGII
ncbi:MAG: hypothetical protein P8L42_07640 [Flavicella sp.]|nr:hypothetical protein [Flavicella sp.]